MKHLRRYLPLVLGLGFVLLGSHAAFALTNEDIAGVYQGTSTATLPNGQTATAALTVTLKPGGREKVTAVYNGQTTTSKANYQFVSDDVILGTSATSEFVAFVQQSGSTLTLTILANEGSGIYVNEKTILTLTRKL